MKNCLKRNIPSKKEQNTRKEIIRAQQCRSYRTDGVIGFVDGNNKTGKEGRIANSVLVWNLPYIKTCPGASELCKSICYNAAYDINDNSDANLLQYNEDKDQLMEYINEILKCRLKHGKVIVRLHSEGDFFSEEYVRFWKEIISMNKEVGFWTYTKSWVIPEIRKELVELERLDNINIYYSWDNTMGVKPNNHKLAILTYDIEEYINASKQDVVICPEQYSMVRCCADCGICITNKNNHIVFVTH